MADTITVYPSGYDSVNYSYASIASGYPLSNPVGKNSTSTSACRINLKTGSNAESYVYYLFDLSSIPANAEIETVTCKVKTYISNTTSGRINTRQAQLFAGTTAKGSPYTISTSTTAAQITAGSWTRSELNNCRLRLYAKRGTSYTTTTYYMSLYGADLTITYSVSGEKFFLKTSSGWSQVAVAKTFKKIGGIWVEQENTASAFDEANNYIVTKEV